MVASLLACLTLIPIHAAAEIHWVNPVGREVPAPLPAEAAPAVEQVRARLSDLAPRKSTDKEATGRHVFVQLAGPITDTQRKDLAAGGMRLLAYLGDHAFFASLTPGADTDRIARSQAVVDAVAVQRAWKLHPALATGNVPDWARVGGPAAGNQPADRASPAAPADATDVAAYVLFHPDVPLDPDARSACRRHGARVRAAVASVNGLVVELPLANVPALADEDGVQWIEPPLPRLSEVNNGIRHITQTDAVQSAPYNLDGSGVSVLVYDGGTAWPGHPDFGNRVTALDASGISYHATHVAGTIGGSGAASDGKYRGMAPAATIASYGFEYDGSGYFLYTNPGDIEADYRAAIETHGARVANNSIGMNVARNGFPCEFEGDYGVTSMLIDAIVAGSLGEPTRVVWANGNERGGVRCGTAYHTLAPPAGAKNPIGVGAVNSNDDSVTWFTSWGPTDDGRLKPDVSAPGCQLSDDFGVTSTSTTGKYMTLCGTSMAAPAVTGMCALLIQQWEAMHPGGEPPRNAALKAVLAHSAVDLGPVGPDYQSGYGSVRVRDAVDLVRAGQVFDGEVSQGGAQTFVIRVVAGTPVLKATLAWDDPPAAPNVVTALVNDLDVVAISPKGGRFHLPWTLDPGRPELPAVQTQPDRVNNLEQVVVNDPSPGTWVIQVRGYSVPAGPQVFSLAVSSSASSCSSAGTIAFGSTKATCGATVALTVNDCDLNADPSGAESVTVEVSSLRQISGVRVALTETGPDTATFTGTLRLSAIPGSGGFLVAHGDQPLAVYKDADNGSGRSVSVASTLTVDCVPPQIAEVSASEVAARSAVVTFNTSEPAAARVRFGTACGEQTRDVVTTAYRAAHRITLTGLAPATIYYFSVEVIDEAGLAAAADAQGMCFSFITPVAANYLARQAVFDADLPDHRSVTLTPDGSTDFYAACVEPITELPVDPAGGVWMKNGGEVRLPSGRTVSLYGVPYGKFIIDNSGFLTFKGWDYDGFQSLANHFAMPRVSGLFGWYYPTEEGWVSYQQLDDRYAVTWEHVIDARTQRPSTFQVEMFFDGRIRMSWLEIGAYQPIIGLSAGRGMPADFDATDFTVLPACLVDPLVIEPRGPLSSRGLRGGPFEPACRGYRLTNGSDPPAEVAWSAQASQGWFTVSPAGGVLQPGQSVDVRVCVGQTAAQLSAREGVYSGEARFVRAGGAVQARDVELAVRSAVPPHASDVLVITTVDVPVRVTPAAEDDGRPDPPRALSCRLTSPPTHGEVVVGNGAEWTYVPRPGFVGVDRFRYRASDGGTPPDGGDSNEAEVIVRVVAPPAVPGPPSPPDGAVGVPIDAVEISAGSAGPSLMRSAIAAAAWPTGIDDPHFTDPRDKMMSTGRFHEIGIIDLGRGTPRVADLRAFDSVIVWSDDQFADPFALGDRLADYVDGGGGVVVAVFANTIVRTYVNLYGRFSKDNYFCIDYPTPAHACPLISYSPAALGTVLNPFHPAIQGVRSFNGGYQSFRPYSSYLAPGASLVASWSDGAPLVAAREVRGTPRVDLGMYPVSSDVDEWFWNASTDGAALLANSLAHTGGRSRVMTTYDVYFGTENPPTVLLASDLPEPRCPMSKILMYGNTYYWKMVARNRAGTTESPVFSFSTRPVAPVEVTDSLEDPRDLRLPFGVVPKGETRSAELTFCNIDPVNDFLLSGYSIGKAEEYLADYGDGAAPDWRPTEAGLWRVENGEYLAESSTGGEYLQSTYTGRSWRDARVRCRLRRVGGPEFSAAIALRAGDDFVWGEQTTGSAYIVGVSGSGMFYVGRYLNGRFAFLQPWSYSPALRRLAGINEVEVDILGSYLAVRLNGVPAWVGSDTSIGGPGRIALMGYAGEDGMCAEYAFDEVVVDLPRWPEEIMAGSQAISGVELMVGGTPTRAPEDTLPPGSRPAGVPDVTTEAPNEPKELKPRVVWSIEEPPTLPLTVPAGQCASLRVVFAPLFSGPYQARLNLDCNANPAGRLAVQLSGYGGPPYLGITPIQPAEARGPQGGPFEPACINYTLANSGPTAIDWTAAADTTWVDVAPADGVLDPGQNATVTVCINHEADLLPAGTHGVSVGFVDTRLGQTQPRSIALNICPLPAVPDLPQPPDGAEYVGFDEPLSWNVGLWEPRRCIPIGRANVSYTSWNRVLASVIAVSQPQTLLEFQVRLRVDADVDLQFLVFEAAARDGPYAPVLTRTVRAMAAGETTYSSGSVHVKLEPGRFYALGLAWGDRAVGFGLEARPCPVEWELGTVEGYISRRLAGSALQPPGGPMAGALLPLTLCVTEGGAVAYDVYLGRAGEAPVPVCAGSPAPDCMPPETLAYDTNYFWQVFSETPCGRTAGPRWSFRTGGCAMFPPLIDRRPGRGPVLRRVHGRYGPFDLDLETPPPGHDVAIESRTGPGSRVVLRFTRPIDGAGGLDPGDVQVIASSWQAVPVLGVAVDRDMLTIDLPELADGHYTVIPAGIVEASNPSCWVYDGVCFAVLTGDADVNGTINSFDLVRVRRNLYGPVDNSTFRSDVNADGQIDGVDLLIVRARLGRQITGFCP